MATIARTTEAAGLTSTEAASRLEQHGRNEISEPPSPGVLARAANQLRDPMVLLLLGAAAVTVALRDVVDTVVIGLVVILNTTVGVVQEMRAERTVRALRRLAAPKARVIRDGSHLVIPAAELVPGDLVQLDAGDIVPADASLLQATALQVDELSGTVDSRQPGNTVMPDVSSPSVSPAERSTKTNSVCVRSCFANCVDGASRGPWRSATDDPRSH